ncbi:MAG: UDP-N-acetylenolpyruvoylglucosamine reductase, partial [Planctomycetota bacterium]
ELNLKGLCEGGAQVSELHGNFIVNTEQTATTADVLALVSKVQEKVYEEEGVRLEREVIVVGEGSE